MGYDAQGVVAIRAPEVQTERIRIDTPSNSDSEPENIGLASGVPDAGEEEREKWSRWSLLVTSVQAAVDRARLALDASLFEPGSFLSVLYFDHRRSLDLSPRCRLPRGSEICGWR